jgi:hypothetical protein
MICIQYEEMYFFSNSHKVIIVFNVILVIINTRSQMSINHITTMSNRFNSFKII